MKSRKIPGLVWLLSGFVLLALFTGSCKTSQATVDSKDLSYLYNPTKNPINPRYNILNESEGRSVLSVKFFANDLFFSQANPEGVPMAQLILNVKLFNISNGKTLADTAYSNLSIVKESGKQEYVYRVPLKVEKATDYIIDIKILDRLRLQVIQAFVPFNTKSDLSRYNFAIVGHFQKNELFNPVIRANEYVNLIYAHARPDSIFISYFRPFTGIPDPPSMLLPEKTLDYEPERVVALHYSDTLPMMFPKEGIYLCSIDKQIRDGFTVFNFGPDFPTMTKPEEMIEPLAYLASADELDAMRTSVKQKTALDDFWIKCGGNVDRARELIRIYYTRVLYSNYYFTSYKEGWRTERGMIYIIYGPPDKVYKSTEGESWGYRKPVIKSAWGGRYTVNDEYLYFNFRKRPSVYTDNDYYISRSETLVTYWDQAIQNWRKGVVFRLDNPEGI